MAKFLSSKQISYLRGLAHKLDPVVTVGNAGVTEGVVKELDFTLKTFELVKVKVRCDDQESLAEVVDGLSASVKATKVQVIGHTAIFYRRSKEPKIAVPGMPMPEPKVEEVAKPVFKKTYKKVYGKSAPKREDSTKRWGRLARVKKDPSEAKSFSGERERSSTGRGFSKGRK
jgi:RNA-binding protein